MYAHIHTQLEHNICTVLHLYVMKPASHQITVMHLTTFLFVATWHKVELLNSQCQFPMIQPDDFGKYIYIMSLQWIDVCFFFLSLGITNSESHCTYSFVNMRVCL